MGAAHRYSDSELESMLRDTESNLVERKESLRGDAPTGTRLRQLVRNAVMHRSYEGTNMKMLASADDPRPLST